MLLGCSTALTVIMGVVGVTLYFKNAKNEKARAKAAAKAANLKTQYEEQKVKAAEDRAKQAANVAQANTMIGTYYDALKGGETYKNLQRKIKEEYKKKKG